MKPLDTTNTRRNQGRWIRRGVRWTALVVAVLLTLPLVPWPSAVLVLPALSPFVAVGSWLCGAEMPTAASASILVAAICVCSRRFFCRYLCPMGLLLDCAANVPIRKPPVAWMPRCGYPVVIMTWVGAAFGFPLFLWLDPLAQFSSLFGNRIHDWVWVLPVGLITISTVLPRIWCTRVCPLGATQDLLRLPAKGRRALARAMDGEPRGTAAPAGGSFVFRRRTVLTAVGLCLATGLGTAMWRRARGRYGRLAPPLRPPGAAGEDQFSALCIRCGNCLQACPANVLRPDLAPDSFASLAAPLVTFEDDYCREDCHVCTQVCPSGAIRRLSLKDKSEYKIGVAVIEFDLCLLARDRECEICQRVCPRDAVTFGWSEQEYTVIPQFDADRCNGCGACLVSCPGANDWEQKAHPRIRPRKAISISTCSPAVA